MACLNAAITLPDDQAAANPQRLVHWRQALRPWESKEEGNIFEAYVECRGNRPWERDVYIPQSEGNDSVWVAEATFITWLRAHCFATVQRAPIFCYKQIMMKSYPKTKRGECGFRPFRRGAAGSTDGARNPPPLEAPAGFPVTVPRQYQSELQQAFLIKPLPEPLPQFDEESYDDDDEEEDEEIQEDVDGAQTQDDSEDDDSHETSPEGPLTLSCGFGFGGISASYLAALGSPSRSFSRKRHVARDEDESEDSLGQPMRKRQRR